MKLLDERESVEHQVLLAGVSARWEDVIALKEKASIDGFVNLKCHDVQRV